MSRPLDVLAVLVADHETVRRQFEQYRALSPDDTRRRQALAEQICLALTIHARLQDELLYPLLRDTLGEDEWLDQALEQHDAAHDLVAQLLGMRADETLHDARLAVLQERIEQLRRLEHERLFPALRQTEVDLDRLTLRLLERKRELQAVPEALREQALVSLVA